MGRPSHKGGQGNAPGQRQLRVGEQIRHTLSQLLMRGEIREPELENASITVSEVRVSPDLKNATAFVMPLGGHRREEILDALERTAPLLRKLVSSQLTLRYAPKLSFRLDHSFDEANRINALLQHPSVVRDLKPADDEE